jgi:hemolysin activation/secretion protein
MELRTQLPFLLNEVQLVGAHVLPEKVITDAMRPLVGRRVTRGRVWKALRAADEWFAEHGYVASRVAVATWPARPNGNVLFVTTVDAVLAQVRLQSLTKDNEVDMSTPVRTSPSTVARALGIKVGDIFRWHPRNFNRIMQLGVFEFARAELEPINIREVVVIVSPH